MTALAKFYAAANGKPVIQEHAMMPDTKTPGVSVTQVFPYQSFFDSGLLQKAILTQSPNQPIVNNPTTPMIKVGLDGYAVGLHPSSQTPIAFQPLGGGGQNASAQAIVLRPGQIYRPHGKPGGGPGHFAGFEWGLPFGWLGGGVATLYVFASPDADVAWPGDAEVIYQRQRMEIYGAGNAPPAAVPFNWPQRFPWAHAVGPNNQTQAGLPTISITQPTRIEMSLVLTSLAAPDTMRMFLWGSNDFAVNGITGVIDTTLTRFIDYTWGSYAAEAPGSNITTAYPVAELSGEMVRLAADDGGMLLWSLSTNTDQNLSGAFVDVTRYGRI